MKQITVTLNIDEDVLLAESGQENLNDAIDQELGWLHDSGMFVESWSYNGPETQREQQPNNEIPLVLSEIEQRIFDTLQTDAYKKVHPHVVEESREKQEETITAPASLDLQINRDKLNRYLEDDMIMEFASPEDCLEYFNTYDGQNFKTVDELKSFQGQYGFGLDGKWYHVSFDEALDVWEKPSLSNQIQSASTRVSDSHSLPGSNVPARKPESER